MPFTFAHPAIVLPLNYLPKRMASLTALIVGSITPDFEYFIRMRVKSIYSHTWPGLFWFDLPLGLALVFLYNGLIKGRLIDHLPGQLNRRFSLLRNSEHVHHSVYQLIVIAVSVVAGAASHILWDGFTHSGGYFVRVIPALSSIVHYGNHQVYLYKIIQHASTIFGLLVICVVIGQLPKSDKTTKSSISGFWLIIAASIAISLTIRLLTGIAWREYGNLVVVGISGTLIGLIIASLAFYNEKKV